MKAAEIRRYILASLKPPRYDTRVDYHIFEQMFEDSPKDDCPIINLIAAGHRPIKFIEEWMANNKLTYRQEYATGHIYIRKI